MSKINRRSFRVEALEQRILLSAVPSDGALAGEEVDEIDDLSTSMIIEAEKIGGSEAGESGDGFDSEYGWDEIGDTEDSLFEGASEILSEPEDPSSTDSEDSAEEAPSRVFFAAQESVVMTVSADPVSLLEFIYPDYLTLDPTTTSVLDLTPTANPSALIGIGEGAIGDFTLDVGDLDFISDFDQILIGNESNPFSFNLGVVAYEGSLAFEGDDVSGTLTAIGDGIDASIKAGDFQIGVSDASFGLFIDADSKIALEAIGTLDSDLPSGLELSADSVVLKLNETDDVLTGQALSVAGSNFTFSEMPAAGTAPFVEVQVDGAELSAFGFVEILGDFAFTNSTESVTLDDASAVSVNTLQFGSSDLSVFAGLNGGTDDAIGLSLTNVDLAFALLSDSSDFSRFWTSLQLSADEVTFSGLSGVDITANAIDVVVNQMSADGRLVDYATQGLTIATGASSSITFDMDSDRGELLEASGNMDIDLFGFIALSGSFAIEKSSDSVLLSDGDTVSVDKLVLGGSGISSFVGLNGGTANAVGFGLQNLEFALAIFSEIGTGSGLRSWLSLQASADSSGFSGIDGVTVTATALTVAINRAASDETVVDYSTDSLEVTTGPSSTLSLDLDGSRGELLEVSGNVDIDLFGFFQLDGDFAFSRSEADLPVFANNVTADVTTDLLTVGANDVSGFAGIDNGALGLDLDNLDLALIFAVEQGGDFRQWIALSAIADSISFVGFSALTLSAGAANAKLNREAEDGSVLDFSATPLTVATGPSSSIDLDFDGSLGALEEISGDLTIDVADFVSLSGTFGFARNTQDGVTQFVGTGDDVTASLEVTSDVYVRVENADFGLFGDTADQFAFELSNGSFDLKLGPLADVSADSVFVQYTNSNTVVSAGGDTTTVTAGDSSYTFENEIAADTIAFSVAGFEANIADFVSLEGDLGFRIENSDIVALGNDLTARMGVNATTYAEVTGASFGLIAGDGTFGLELSEGSFDASVAGLTNVSATGVVLRYTDINTSIAANSSIEVGGISYIFEEAISADTVLFQVTGFSAGAFSVASFSGNLAFRKVSNEIRAIGSNVSARLGTGPVTVGLDSGAFGIVINEDGFALEASGSVFFDGGPIASVSADEAILRINTTGALWTGEEIEIDSQTYTFQDVAASTDLTVVELIGLEASLLSSVYIRGDFAFEADGVENTLTAVGADIEAGIQVGDFEVGVTNGSFGLLFDDAGTMALEVQGSIFSDLPADLELSADSVVFKVNETDTDLTGETLTVSGTSYTFGDLPAAGSSPFVQLQVSGANLSAFGFVNITGDFAFTSSTETVTLDDASVVTVDALLLGSSGLSVFAGLNGGTDDAIGLSLTNVDLAFALLSDSADSARFWTSLQLSANEVTFSGIPGVEISADTIDVAVNQMSADDRLVDYSTQGLTISTGTSSSITLDMNSDRGELLEASGNLEVDLFGFFTLTGSFALEKSSDSVVLSDGDTVSVDKLTFGGSNINSFVGINGGTADAVGFGLQNLDFALAILSENNVGSAAATRSWISLQANADSDGFTGIDGVSVTATALTVAINRAASDGTVVDYATESLEVATGPSTTFSLDMDGSRGELLEVSGTVTIDLFGFFQLNGDFAFSKSEETVSVYESGSTTDVDVDLLTIGANDVNAFAGIDGSLGFNLSDVDFAIAFAVEQGGDARKWTALQADASSAAFVGLDGLTLAAGDISVIVNKVADDGSTLDFSTTALTVATGPTSSTDLTMDGSRGNIEEIRGDLTIDVAGFVSLSGTFAFGRTVQGATSEFIGMGENITASLNVSDSIYVRSEGANFGLFSNSDGELAFELSDGNLALQLGPLANVSADSILIQYTNASTTVSAGGDAKTISAAGLTYTFDEEIAADTVAFAVAGFSADIVNFLTIEGDLGFRKAGTDIIAVGANLRTGLELNDSVYVRLSNAGFGLIAGQGTFGFEFSGGTLDVALGPLANVTVGSVSVQYTNTVTLIAEDQETLTVGGISYDFSGEIKANTIAFSLGDFRAEILNFITLEGNIGFSKSGDAITAVGSEISASLEASDSVYVRVEDAAFGMLVDADGFGFEISQGSLNVALGPLANVEATSVFVQYTDATRTFDEGDVIVAGTESYTISNAAVAGTVSFAVSGLSADVLGFVGLTGNFGFSKSGGEIIAVGTQITTGLEISDSIFARIVDASFGLVASDDNFVFEVGGGTFEFGLGPLAELTVATVVVRYASETGTGIAADRVLSVGPVIYTFEEAIDAGEIGIFLDGVTANVLDFVHVSGSLSIEKTSATVTLSDASSVDVDVLTIGGASINIFAGVGFGTDDAVGLSLENIGFGLALFNDSDDPGRSWSALTASASALGFVGISDFLPTGSNVLVEMNQAASDDTVIDFSGANAFSIATGVTTTVDLTTDGALGEFIRAEADVSFRLFDFIYIEGRFGFERLTPTASIVLSNGLPVPSASMLAITGQGIDAFVGYADGGIDSSLTFAEQSDNLYGFGVEGLDFGLLLTRTVGKTYTSFRADMDTLQVYGFDTDIFELSFTDASFQANMAPANGPAIDFIESFGEDGFSVGSGEAVTFDFTGKRLGVYFGNATLALGDFVYFSGAIAFEQADYGNSLSASSGNLPALPVVAARGFSVGGSDITAFVGYADGGIDRDQTLAEQADNLYGFGVDSLSFGYLNVRDAGGTVYHALKATAAEVALYGFDADEFELSAKDISIIFNQSTHPSNTLDFSDDSLDVPTGGEPVTFDFKGKRIGVYVGEATLTISQFVYLRGAIAFEQGSFGTLIGQNNLPITNTRGFSIGGADIDVFIGYASEPLDLDQPFADQQDNLFGFGAEDIDFGLVLVQSGAVRYTALRASVDTVAVYGLDADDFQLSVTGAELNVNFASGAASPINWVTSFSDTNGLEVQTGGDPVLLDMTGEVIGVSLDEAILQISEFVYLQGSFAFTKGATSTISVTTVGNVRIDDVKVNSIEIGASGVQAFVGLNGPYRTVENGVLSDPNEDALGLVVDNLTFGMALMLAQRNILAPASNVVVGTKFIALKATADQVGFVGFEDIIDLSLQDVLVGVNFSNNPLFTADLTEGGTTAGYSVATGTTTDPVVLDYTTDLIEATVGTATAKIAGILSIEGGVTFQRKTISDVDFRLPGTTVTADASALIIAGQDVDAFAGIDIDGGPRIGFEVVDLDFAFAMLTPTLGGGQTLPANFFALSATADSVGLVGTSPFVTLEAEDVIFEFNGAFFNGYPVPFTYVDFTSLNNGLGLDIPIGTLGDSLNIDYDSNFLRVAMTGRIGLFDLFEFETTFDFAFELPDTGDLIPVISLSGLLDLVPEFPVGAPQWLIDGFDSLKNINLSIGINGIIGSIELPNLSINIGDFIHMRGDFTLTIGESFTADMATSLPSDISGIQDVLSTALGDDFQTFLDLLDTLGVDPTDYSVIPDVTFEGVSFGATDVSIFVGVGTPNFDVPLSEQGDLVGFGIQNVDVALGFYQADLPSFFSPKKVLSLAVTAEELGVYGFEDLMEIFGQDVSVDLNIGGELIGDIVTARPIYNTVRSDIEADDDGTFYIPARVLGEVGIKNSSSSTNFNLTADQNSAQAIDAIRNAFAELDGIDIGDVVVTGSRLDGYEVSLTSANAAALMEDTTVTLPALEVETGGAPAYLNHDGNELIRLEIAEARVTIANFFYLSGSLAFEKGPVYNVNLATGIPATLGSALGSLGLDSLASAVGSVAGVTIGENFSTIENLPMESLSLGGANLKAFAGIGDFDFDKSFAEQDDFFGFAIDDLNFAVSMFTSAFPIPNFPTLIAATAEASEFAFQAGASEVMKLTGQDIRFNLNLGSKWSGTPFNPALDFESTFPGDLNEGVPPGFRVSTGDPENPIYIDFDGNTRIGVEIGFAEIEVFDFLYLSGSFAFELGPTAVVDIEPGFLAELSVPTIAQEVEILTIGAKDVNGFAGIGGPYRTDTDGDGDIDDDDDVNEDAIGVTINNVDFAMAMMSL
ncbi:MAG: LEPR-XLL domain-containing protein, partial [Verrucomicrobiota bacterium]